MNSYDDPKVRVLRHRLWRALDEMKHLKKRHRNAEQIASTSEYASDKRLAERLAWELDQALIRAKEINTQLQQAKNR